MGSLCKSGSRITTTLLVVTLCCIGWLRLAQAVPGLCDGPSTDVYNLLMAYRAEYGLPSIPRCHELDVVAFDHVWDLDSHHPDSPPCNMHSWSTVTAPGTQWTPCCYTPDHAAAQCMWDKPRELTAYQGDGFEIAHAVWGALETAEGAVDGWRGSPPHSDVILNRGIWSDEWQAVGTAVGNGYATAWFGKEPCPS